MKSLQGFLFTTVKSLANINKGWKIRVEGPKATGNPRANVRCRYGKRWFIGSMPVILMATVQDKTEVRRAIGFNQGAAIHDGTDFLQPFSKLQPVNRGIYGRKSG